MERPTTRVGVLWRLAPILAFCVAVGGVGGILIDAPVAAAAGCSGVSVGLASADVPAGQTADLAITASGVPAPGVAGFQLTVAYDPSTVTVTSVQGGADFPDTVANTSQAGSVVLAGANAQGFSGSPTLAVLSIHAAATAGSVANLTVTSSELVDSNLNTIASCGQSGTLTVTGTQATALQVTSTLLPPGLTGTPYNQTLSAVGGTGPYTWAVAAGSLPGGLSLDPVTGNLAGMPATSGLATFTAQVTDSAGHTASQALRLLVNPAGATLAVATTTLPGGSVGALYSATLSATGGTSPYTWTVDGTLPSGLTLDGTTGRITGTPTSAGPASFTVQATDSSNPTELATQPLTILVAPSDVTVVATSTSSTTSASTPVTVGGAGTTMPETTAMAAGGTGTLTTSQYGTNPQPSAAQAFQAGGAYFDVDVAPQSAFQTLAIQQCGLTAAETLYWWTGTAWAAVSPQAYAAGCVTALLQTTGTSPTIGELTGTAFAAAVAAASTPAGSTPPPTAQSVGPNGGPLATTDGAFSMTLPAGAISGTLTLTESTGVPTDLPAGMAAASAVFTLTGSPLAAPQPATIRYATGWAPNGLSVYKQGAQGTWTFLPTALNPSAGTASALISGPATLVVLADSQVVTDVAAGYWAASDIDTLLAAGVADGFPDGTFRPDATLTRAQFVKMLALTLDLPSGSGPARFTDVAAGDWFAPYVSAAVQAGLVQGTSATTFSPSAPVTREQLAVLLARALKLTGTAQLAYSDSSAIDPWAAASVQSAEAAGYVAGFPDGTFQPQGPTTRAQAAKVLAAVIAHLAP